MQAEYVRIYRRTLHATGFCSLILAFSGANLLKRLQFLTFYPTAVNCFLFKNLLHVSERGNISQEREKVKLQICLHGKKNNCEKQQNGKILRLYIIRSVKLFFVAVFQKKQKNFTESVNVVY